MCLNPVHWRLHSSACAPVCVYPIQVQILFKRLTDPEVIRREEEMKRKKEAAEAKARETGKQDRGNAKPGAWGGLPSRR